MDSKVELYMNALRRVQRGGAYMPVYQGSYRYQYGGGLGDILKSVWRFFFPVAMKGAASFFNAGNSALKSGAAVSQVLKSGLKPALGSMLKTAGKELVRSSVSNAMTGTAPPMYSDGAETGTLPPQQIQQITNSESQKGSGGGRRRKPRTTNYRKRSAPTIKSKRNSPKSRKLPTTYGYNF